MSDALQKSTPPVWPPVKAVPRVGPQAAIIERLFLRLTMAALILCLGSDVFGGVARFALATVGVPFLIYVPLVSSAGVAGSYFLYQVATSRMDPRTFAILAFFVAYTIYSLLVGEARGGARFEMVGFSLYTWTPFFLGLALASQGAEERLVRFAPLCWVLAIVGVVINYFVHFPWTGSSFTVLGRESEIARGWSTNGLERLAGFSRASYTAAHEITLFGIVLISSPRVRWAVGIIIWTLSVAAVALTTSKTPLLALALVPPAVWGLRALMSRGGRGWPLQPAMVTLGGLLAVMVLLPASSAAQDLLFKYSFGDVGFLTFSSMLDRMTTMWPGAFALIANDHNPLEWVLGRGLGSIGAAQYIFEPNEANAADNLFVFLYVTFGVNCFVFGLALFTRVRAVYRETGERFVLFFALAATMLTMGIATSIVESIVPALALGILAGRTGPPHPSPSVLR
jgi:hypothetical protein